MKFTLLDGNHYFKFSTAIATTLIIASNMYHIVLSFIITLQTGCNSPYSLMSNTLPQ